ncbi:MAG: hypothetical protein PHY28_01670 [Dehalococcoidales bacterium]|nr:hypothetical protein [Dehalococcoidales bacterium]
MPRAAGTFFIIAAVLAISLFPPPVVLAAPPPVDLELAGAGAMPWYITNIKPGDSGTQMLTLRNAGNASGALTIWISDIVDNQTASPPVVPVNPAEPGQLSKHLLLQPVSNRLSTAITMPASLADYPQSADDAAKITVSPIAAGETIDLIWEWQLPVTVGNAVQSNSSSFTINYNLVEMPVTPVDETAGGGGSVIISPPPASNPFIITSPEKQTVMTVDNDGTVTETQAIAVISERVTIGFERGTRIITMGSDSAIPTELRITLKEDPPTPPEGMAFVGSVYELLFYAGEVPLTVTLSQPARIILNYDLAELAARMSTLFVASYDSKLGWTQLQQIGGFIAGADQVGALVNHFSLFAVMAELEPEQPVITPTVITPPPVTTPPVPSVVPAPLPARFQVSNLTLSRQELASGEMVTIRINVMNNGEMTGEHLLILKVNGLFVDSKVVQLTPGQNRNISFVISPHVAGVYQIEIDGLSETIIVTETLVPVDGFKIWPLPAIPVIIGIIVLLAFVLFVRRRRRSIQ